MKTKTSTSIGNTSSTLTIIAHATNFGHNFKIQINKEGNVRIGRYETNGSSNSRTYWTYWAPLKDAFADFPTTQRLMLAGEPIRPSRLAEIAENVMFNYFHG